MFNDDVEVCLFYFAGHGYKDDTSAYLSTYDYTSNNPGVALDYLLKKVNASKCKNKIIILDCCHAGNIGKNFNFLDNVSIIGDGVILLASCKDSKKALEENNHGVFTGLILEGLNGTAADILGRVYLLPLYSYVSRSLNSWKQRPILKCNITHDLVIRKSKPRVKLSVLKTAMRLFKNIDDSIQLDPTYYDFTKGFDPLNIMPIKSDEDKFKLFLDLYKNQLITTSSSSLFLVARNSNYINLTYEGKFYWHQVNKKLI